MLIQCQTLSEQLRLIIQPLLQSDGANIETLFDQVYDLYSFIRKTSKITDLFIIDPCRNANALFNSLSHLIQLPSIQYQLDQNELDTYYLIHILIKVIGAITYSVGGDILLYGQTFHHFIDTTMKLFEFNVSRLYPNYDDAIAYTIFNTSTANPTIEINTTQFLHEEDNTYDYLPHKFDRLGKRFFLEKLDSGTDDDNYSIDFKGSTHNDHNEDDDLPFGLINQKHQDEDQVEDDDIHQEIINNLCIIITSVTHNREVLFQHQLYRFIYFLSATGYYNKTIETRFCTPILLFSIHQSILQLLTNQLTFSQLAHQQPTILCDNTNSTTNHSTPPSTTLSNHLSDASSPNISEQLDSLVARDEEHLYTTVYPKHLNLISFVSIYKMLFDYLCNLGFDKEYTNLELVLRLILQWNHYAIHQLTQINGRFAFVMKFISPLQFIPQLELAARSSAIYSTPLFQLVCNILFQCKTLASLQQQQPILA